MQPAVQSEARRRVRVGPPAIVTDDPDVVPGQKVLRGRTALDRLAYGDPSVTPQKRLLGPSCATVRLGSVCARRSWVSAGAIRAVADGLGAVVTGVSRAFTGR